jgi:HAD superfamily hydrolase (TIGR01509 family)
MVKAIIFDLDGVLVDATDWHYEALNKALAVFGLGIGREDHLKTFNGLPTSKKLLMMNIPTGLHPIIKELKKKYTKEVVDELCHPDIEKKIMLGELKKKYRLACCSNAIKESVVQMLKNAQIDNYFELILGNDEITNPKPNPEIYLKTFATLGLEPTECLIIEDAFYGIKAAQESGARVLAIKEPKDANLGLFQDLGLL